MLLGVLCSATPDGYTKDLAMSFEKVKRRLLAARRAADRTKLRKPAKVPSSRSLSSKTRGARLLKRTNSSTRFFGGRGGRAAVRRGGGPCHHHVGFQRGCHRLQPPRSASERSKQALSEEGERAAAEVVEAEGAAAVDAGPLAEEEAVQEAASDAGGLSASKSSTSSKVSEVVQFKAQTEPAEETLYWSTLHFAGIKQSMAKEMKEVMSRQARPLAKESGPAWYAAFSPVFEANWNDLVTPNRSVPAEWQPRWELLWQPIWDAMFPKSAEEQPHKDMSHFDCMKTQMAETMKGVMSRQGRPLAKGPDPCWLRVFDPIFFAKWEELVAPSRDVPEAWQPRWNILWQPIWDAMYPKSAEEPYWSVAHSVTMKKEMAAAMKAVMGRQDHALAMGPDLFWLRVFNPVFVTKWEELVAQNRAVSEEWQARWDLLWPPMWDAMSAKSKGHQRFCTESHQDGAKALKPIKFGSSRPMAKYTDADGHNDHQGPPVDSAAGSAMPHLVHTLASGDLCAPPPFPSINEAMDRKYPTAPPPGRWGVPFAGQLRAPHIVAPPGGWDKPCAVPPPGTWDEPRAAFKAVASAPRWRRHQGGGTSHVQAVQHNLSG
eukprot:TRINITY_DN2366_c0_g1_i4.p1 TRINITY_DN2366_c0_g1~~TRINITY_DN2366_c0_g1_i4.p1  ORF type:complete len:601 (-),score=115.98 TRINITY_DN2366_c0_g1_i4:127-1929(-)